MKQTENQLDLMKRRLSALRIKDEKNSKRSETTMKKVKYHSFLQDLEQRERDKRQVHRQQVQKKVEFQRNLNSAERSTRKHHLREAKRMFQDGKHESYLVVFQCLIVHIRGYIETLFETILF